MDTPSTSIRDLARRLVAMDAARPSASQPRAHEVLRICETLRGSLTRFAGLDGFTSLLRRALALARAEVPALQTVSVNADGHIEGLEEAATDPGNSGDGGAEAAAAITAHLLSLLATFIGEPLTLQLLRQVWTDASLEE